MFVREFISSTLLLLFTGTLLLGGAALLLHGTINLLRGQKERIPPSNGPAPTGEAESAKTESVRRAA